MHLLPDRQKDRISINCRKDTHYYTIVLYICNGKIS